MAQSKARTAIALALGLGAGIIAGRIGVLGAMLTRLMIAGQRLPLWRTPAELGMPAESVAFVAEDGVGLQGWFIRAAGDSVRPTIVFVHGWPWNRCGNLAGQSPIPDATVDFLEPAQALHAAGFHVLLFDLRNHGMSDASPPVTFGLREARDLQAAVSFLRTRSEVDVQRIGLIGYSMGANTVLYALPHIQPIRAAVVVQPVRIATFAPHFAAAILGPIGPLLLSLAEPLYRAFGGPPLNAIDPTGAAALSGETTLLFIQGDNDPWGSLAEVGQMVAAAPHARPLVTVPSMDRYGGYQYVGQHRTEIVAFFRELLGA
jgi:pimeloyl-ACP methyl ester carboxylesterase